MEDKVRRNRLTIAASLAVTAAFIAPAWAARWDAWVDGPNIFGTTSVLASVDGSENSLVIQCNGEDELNLAVITPMSPSDMEVISNAHPIPAKLLIRIDNGDVKTFDAVMRGWNKSHAGVVVEGRSADVIDAVRAIGGAKRVIDIGTVVLGTRATGTFPAIGSTAAIKKVMEHCKLGGAG